MRQSTHATNHTPHAVPVRGRGKRRAMMRARARGVRAHSSGRDRGTVLLMVLGVLALMSIIAVVYAALGKSDRAASASIVKSTRLDDQVDQIADYLAGVIRDDQFSTWMLSDARQGGQGGTVRWEGWDAPFTDPQMRSQPAAPNAALPDGEYRFNPAGTYSTRWNNPGLPDPRQGSDPFISSSEPEWLRFKAGQNNPTDPLRPYLDKTDWPAISNFAPSGNFVNLWNLRNNFTAESGFGFDSRGRPRMSENLSLLNENGQVTYDLPNNGPAADPRIPAHWTNDQIRAFRPMYDDLDPDNPEHIANQWMDTDGDGFADARPFELVDVWNQDDVRAVIPNAGRARLFVGARCVDLSGRINVNTAGDFFSAPERRDVGTKSVQMVAGMGPQDVDLLRILYRTDSLDTLGNIGECYRECAQPNPNSAGYYGGFARAESFAGGTSAYLAMWSMRNPGRFLGANPGALSNRVLPKELRFPNPGVASALPSAVERLQFYSLFGSSQDGARYLGTNSREVVGSFDMADELELRTFETVNDSTRQSRLEATTAGRSNSAANPPMSDYDPLRSNRPRNIEMTGRDRPTPTDQALLAAEIDVRRLLTTLSASRPLVERAVSFGDAAFDPTRPVDNVRTNATALLNDCRVYNAGNSAAAARVRDDATLLFFREFAAALMPYTDSTLFPDAWNPLRGMGLSYGGRAELAYQMAAHLALNLRGAVTERSPGNVDGPEKQTPPIATLDFTPQAVTAQISGGSMYSDEFPWRKLNLGNSASALRRLTPDPNYIRGTQVDGANVAKRNVYGITPQPFIAQVTAINLFADAPPNAGGDDDVAANWSQGANPEPLDPITINAAQSLTNADFLFSVLAFQITNPFDVDVELEPEMFDSRSFYYIEYAGRTYRLRPQDPTSATGFKMSADTGRGETVLKAGETKVFYATFPASRIEVEQRVNDVRQGLANRLRTGGGTQFDLDEFAKHEFGQTGQFPVHVALCYPESGEAVQSGAGQGLTNADLHATRSEYEVPAGTTPLGGVAASMPRLEQNRPERRVVNLWRVLRDETRPDGTVGKDGPSLDNDPKNDQLVDRMRDPSTILEHADGVLVTSLVDPFGAADLNKDVPGTKAGDDSGGASAVFDNTGFAFASYASITRPTNPVAASATAPRVARGAMPIWCYEAKADNEYLGQNMTRLSLNKADDASPWASGGEYRAGRDSHYDALGRLISETRAGSTTFIDDQLAKPAENKTNNPYDVIDTVRQTLAQSAGLPAASVRGYPEGAPVLRRINGQNDTYANNTGNSRALFSRVGDLLLPLAIGPSQDPAAVGNDTNAPDIAVVGAARRIKDLEARWTTLGEALALAGDYYSPQVVTDHPFYHFGRDTRGLVAPGAPAEVAKTDRGCLMLDSWAPYLERGGAAAWYDPGIDEPLGNGIPLALNILDQFSVSGMVGWTGVTVTGASNAATLAEIINGLPSGSATRAMNGLININTAPLAVLRALPLLSPDPNGWLNTFDATPSGDERLWLAGAIDPATGMPTQSKLWDPTAALAHSDIAASLVAYRDKISLLTRRFLSGQSNLGVEVNFREDRQGTRRVAPGTSRPVSGREDATGIDRLRTGRGFKSVGEVMAVQIAKSTDPRVQAATSGLPSPVDVDNSITRYGLDGKATFSPALDPAVTLDPSNSTQFGPDYIADDYGEKLTVASAILNSITVRSDVFCVWFVIHGYTPEDVAVEDGFPMVPSIARRYVMVVDRSNVTEPGMRPRILMLKEVPLR